MVRAGLPAPAWPAARRPVAFAGGAGISDVRAVAALLLPEWRLPDPEWTAGGGTMEIVGIWRYPVKSLQGEALDAAVVEGDGLEGDRSWGVRDGHTGRILTARRRPELLHAAASYRDEQPVITLPDGRMAEGPGPTTDRLLSEWLGSPVSLVAALGEGPGRAEYFEDATDDTSQAIEWTM